MPTPSELHYTFKFPYQQKLYQDIKGWCGALSEKIIAQIKQSSAVLPADVSEVADLVCDETTKEGSFKKTLLARQQNVFDSAMLIAGKDWTYSFSDSGVAFMRLYVDSSVPVSSATPGGQWSEWSEGTVNHSGVIAWHGNEVFVFDPNCGGATFRPRQPAKGKTFAEDVDVVLGQMYTDTDRDKGRRSCRLVSVPKAYQQSWFDYLAGGNVKF